MLRLYVLYTYTSHLNIPHFFDNKLKQTENCRSGFKTEGPNIGNTTNDARVQFTWSDGTTGGHIGVIGDGNDAIGFGNLTGSTYMTFGGLSYADRKIEATALGATIRDDLQVIGDIVAGGNITSASDERIKYDIVNTDYYPRDISDIDLYSFRREQGSGKTEFGFIAQQLEKVFPEAVLTSPNEGIDDFKSIKVLPLMALMVQEIKILKEQVDFLLEEGEKDTYL